MKIEDFKKTEEELLEQKNKNDEKINISDERTRMASVNQLDYKLGMSLARSMFPYFGLIFGSIFLDKFVDMTAFTSVIPSYSIPMILIGSSLCVGIAINKSTNKKYETKKRFDAFSKAKTESEKVEEEIFYKIELEKANNRNLVIQKTIDTLNSNKSLLNQLSSKYNISEKNELQTEQEAQKRFKELSKILEQKYIELDTLTTQRVLNDRFWRLRAKGQKGIDLTLVTMAGGMLPMMITTLPLITMSNTFEPGSSLVRTLMLSVPSVIGALGTCAYWIKRNKNRETALNNLNNKLGENALPKNIENAYEEEQNLKAMIETKISDISIVEVQLKETQRMLERIASEQTNQQETKNNEKTWNDLSYTEEEIKMYMQESPAPFNPNLIFGTDEIDSQAEQSRPKLVMKPIPSNNTTTK